MAIIIEPLGGLGNQLFVYGTGLARALDLGTELMADLRHFRDYEWHNYELDTFHSGLTLVESSASQKLKRRQRDWYYRILRKLNQPPRWSRYSEVVEDSNRFDERVNFVTDGTRLRGYFQSPKYFSRHADSVRARIRTIKSPSDWYFETIDQLNAMGRWAAIHVRRGNYVGLPNMGLAQDDYYRRALALLLSCNREVELVVFSDDVEAARLLPTLQSCKRITFIQPAIQATPLESLLAMSKAHHIVTANSSFSWWAAWLEDRPDRMVVCPRPWLDDPSFDERDLIPAGWVTVGRT